MSPASSNAAALLRSEAVRRADAPVRQTGAKTLYCASGSPQDGAMAHTAPSAATPVDPRHAVSVGGSALSARDSVRAVRNTG
ncbi:hypothetical protein GCM10009602_53660 [Nocardiopsis tropica]